MKQSDYDDLQDVQSEEELLAAFMKIGNSLGFEFGTISFRSGKFGENPIFRSVRATPPGWRTRASDLDLSLTDPVFVQVNTVAKPFIYGPDFYARHGAGPLWEIGAQFGYRNGPCASLHVSPERALLWGFDSDEALPTDECKRMQLVATTQLIGVYACTVAERILGPARILLTDRQKEVLRLVRQGHSSWVISNLINIKEETVNYHMKTIRAILGVSTRLQALDKAIALGLLD